MNVNYEMETRNTRFVGGTAGATLAGLLSWWLHESADIHLPSGLEAGIGGMFGVIGACMYPFFVASGRLALATLKRCARGKPKEPPP